MAEVRVRKLEDGVVDALRERARRERTSVEAILRRLISDEALRPKRELMETLLEHQRMVRETCGVQPDSTVGIREERDRWS